MKDEHKTQAQLISELRQARQHVTRLERECAQYKQMAESDPYYNTPEMFDSVDAVTERVLHCNEALTTELGYTEEELVGYPISKIYHPDCLEDAKTMFSTLVRNDEIRDVELVLQKKDGSKIDVNLSASTIRDTRGNPLYSRFIWRDITQHKQTEMKLRQSEQRFHQLADSIREVFWLMSIEGDKFYYLSPGYDEIWGRSRDDLIAEPMSWVDSIYPDDLEQVLANFERQKRGEFVEYELRIIRPDGEIRWIQARAFPVKDESGKPYRVAGFALDITDRKRAEELSAVHQQQLIQADKMASLGILNAGVAHEINNPNNFILLNGEILEKAWKDVSPILERYYAENGDFACVDMPYTQARDKIANLTTGIIHGAERIQKIVNALGDFAHHDDEESLNQLVDCNTVVGSAMVIVGNLIKSSTNCFSTQLERNLPKVLGSPQQLEQVLINLITNSCQAISDPSQNLVISTRKNSKHVLIEVRDEGEGIPSENLQRIIDAFFTTKRNIGGTGLGLFVSYNIIKKHGGELTFTSELVKGTIATVTLPAAL